VRSKTEATNEIFCDLYELFHKWLAGGFVNPIPISRMEIMLQTHIGSIVTYHKCIRQLRVFGYLIYAPSYNPFIGRYVHLK
jgi:hypothetical protein